MSLIAIGPCYVCKHVFEYDTQNVSTVLINPVTELPLEDNATITSAEGRPLCAVCVTQINEDRAENGLGPIPLPEPTLKLPLDLGSMIRRKM